MSASLSEVLLRVAAAIAADGGASVRAALEGVLRDAAPFDAGEVALVGASEVTWRQPLGALEGPLLGMDLLSHVIAHGAAYRIDDWHDAEPFPETLSLLRGHSFRSLLIVPFLFERPAKPRLAGALAVARSHGWAFVGASLPLLVPLAAMAGLAFDHALVLTDLGERARPPAEAGAGADPLVEATERLGRLLEEAQGTAADRERERDLARNELAALGRDAAAASQALLEERSTIDALRARAEAADGHLSEAERSRDDWARQAASLRGRVDELESERQSGQRDLAGARESAAAAAELAEAGQGRIRELQERLREREGAMTALEADAARGRDELVRRLDEVAGRIASLEHELRASAQSNETLEAERIRLDEDLRQVRSDLSVALDQLAVLTAPADPIVPVVSGAPADLLASPAPATDPRVGRGRRKRGPRS